MRYVKDKTGRILYSVESQVRKQPRRRVLFVIQAVLFGIAFYGMITLWALAEVLR